jgi:hypothetical protein
VHTGFLELDGWILMDGGPPGQWSWRGNCGSQFEGGQTLKCATTAFGYPFPFPAVTQRLSAERKEVFGKDTKIEDGSDIYGMQEIKKNIL